MHSHILLALIFWEQRGLLGVRATRLYCKGIRYGDSSQLPAVCLFTENPFISSACLSVSGSYSFITHTHKPQTARHETAEYQKWYKTADIFTLQNCYLNNSLMTRQLELCGAIKIFSTTCQLFYFFLESSSIEYMNLSRLNLYRHFDPRLIFGFSCKLNGEKCHSGSVSLAHSPKKSCKKISTAFNSPASWVFRICWFGPEWRQEDIKDELKTVQEK